MNAIYEVTDYSYIDAHQQFELVLAKRQNSHTAPLMRKSIVPTDAQEMFRSSLISKHQWTASQLQTLMNWWPPFGFGSSIRVTRIQEDFRYAKVELPLRWYNQNYVGTHFGGSLYAMCDPMYMLLLLNTLGGPREFVVWDKRASIHYRKPGTGVVTAEFFLEDALVASIQSMGSGEKRDIDLTVDVKDADGDVVASLVKTLYIRRKEPTTTASRSPS